MPYQVLAPERKTFTLDIVDAAHGITEEADRTRVTVKQATTREQQIRSQLFSEYVTEQMPNGNERLILKLPLFDLVMRETYLTLVDCNITDPEGKPLFRFKKVGENQVLDMTMQQFQTAWGQIPEEVTLEIHSKVLEVNQQWRMSQDESRLGE